MISVRRLGCTFYLKKSEAIIVFKKFKAMVEKEAGVFIKALRTDREGEFTTFCEENDAHGQLTTAYAPQQNGVSESKMGLYIYLITVIETK